MPRKKGTRPDKDGTHRAQFDKNKKIIYATQTVCGICGLPVDKTLRFPNPMSKTVDHIIPIAKGGHPSDISNLQLAHLVCNRQKSDSLPGASGEKKQETNEIISNRDLPLSYDWTKYKSA